METQENRLLDMMGAGRGVGKERVGCLQRATRKHTSLYVEQMEMRICCRTQGTQPRLCINLQG